MTEILSRSEWARLAKAHPPLAQALHDHADMVADLRAELESEKAAHADADRCLRMFGPDMIENARKLQQEKDDLRERADQAEALYSDSIDKICHYRNLAIKYNAPPELMLDKHDRGLCERGDMDDEGVQKDALLDVWEENEQLESKLDRYRAVAMKVAGRLRDSAGQIERELEDALDAAEKEE